MGITRRKGGDEAFKDQIRKFLSGFDTAAEFRLTYLGEQCVNIARERGSYIDQTGNLRSSVGYVVVHNGRIVKRNFKSFKGAANGTTKARDYAVSLANDNPSGWVLIVVAGMNYALKVESRGRDVLTSAEQYAEAELPGLLRDLKTDVATIR